MTYLQQVKFKDDFLEVVRVAVGEKAEAVKKVKNEWWVSVKKVCENLRLHYVTQHQKIKSDAESFNPQLIEVPTNGGVQKVFCIPLEKLNGWLFTINPNRVKPEVKQKLITYKKECFDVLFNHFIKKAQPTQPPLIENNEQMVEELIKRSDIVRGYQGQIAKLENELAKKQSEILQAQDKQKAINKGIQEAINTRLRQIDKNILQFISCIDKKISEIDELVNAPLQEDKNFISLGGDAYLPKNGRWKELE